jgi:D-alanine-D-alanine ligase
MKIGITYDLKVERPATAVEAVPDDFQEEFDSPVTIEAVSRVLRDMGHEVVPLGDGREMIDKVLAAPPDLVFNFAEGQGIGRSREARVPAFLEMLGIPYTGSDPLTLAATLDKDCAKRWVASAGVPVPRGVAVQPHENPKDACRRAGLTFPLIAKPAWEGSSKGIRTTSLVDREDDLVRTVDSLRQDHRQPVLVEEYIEGEELTVGVFGNAPPRILGVMRVLPQQTGGRFVYSLEVKRDYERQVRYECPAQISPAAMEAVRRATLIVYQTLGCRDVSRVDFRLRGETPYFLEVNPLPGLHPVSSDLVIMAGLCGWTYAQLIGTILHSALERHGLS